MAFLLRSFIGKIPCYSIVEDTLKQSGPLLTAVRYYKMKQILPRKSGNFRRIVHYPEEYTVEPLKITRLGGRDPVTGRKVVTCIGGGIKYKYHWIDFKKTGPTEDVPPLEEKVILIKDVYERTARVALVASGDKIRWIIATDTLAVGDIIQTSQFIPYNPVFGKVGDSYPLGALPIGTVVHSVEKFTGRGSFYCNAAGTCATITRHLGDKVVIVLPSKDEVALPKENMAVLGRVSNPEHQDTPIGSAQRNRELGNRPRSGLWKRKDGRFGRKIHPPTPLKILDNAPKKEMESVQLTLPFKMIHNDTII